MENVKAFDTDIIVKFMGEWTPRRGDPRDVLFGGLMLNIMPHDGRDGAPGFALREIWFSSGTFQQSFLTKTDRERIDRLMRKLDLPLSGFPFENEYPSESWAAFDLPRFKMLPPMSSESITTLAGLLAERLKPLAYDLYHRTERPSGHMSGSPFMTADFAGWADGRRRWGYEFDEHPLPKRYFPSYVRVVTIDE